VTFLKCHIMLTARNTEITRKFKLSSMQMGYSTPLTFILTDHVSHTQSWKGLLSIKQGLSTVRTDSTAPPPPHEGPLQVTIAVCLCFV